jgi:hypothetical protein
MKHKLIMENWRSFIKEQEKVLPAVPARTRIEIPSGAFPMLRPETAAAEALTSRGERIAAIALGKRQSQSPLSDKEKFGLKEGLPLAPISLTADLLLLADGSRCKDARDGAPIWASAVVWGFDLSGPIPGHDISSMFFFEEEENFNKFVTLLTSAGKSGASNGRLGSVKCRRLRATSVEGKKPMATVQDADFNDEDAIMTVGISPVWDEAMGQSLPAVVLIFGKIGELYSGHAPPYFITPKAALRTAADLKRTASEFKAANNGLLYSYPPPEGMWVPEEDSLAVCSTGRLAPPPTTSAGGSEMATVPGIKIGA